MSDSEGLRPADVAACCNGGNNNAGLMGAEMMWPMMMMPMMWMWIWPMFMFGGWGGGFGGWGGNGGGAGFQGALTRGDLCQDMNFSDLESAVRGVNQGLCDGFYAVNTSLLNGFHGVDNAVCNLGYNVQQGFNATQMALAQGQNALATQLADCCCKTQTAIQANTTQGVMNTNAIQQQIQNCCCENEKIAMQSRFDAQQYNCNTLQAIDRLGDRLEARLTAQEMAAKDETIAALRQQLNACDRDKALSAQSVYLTNTLRPCPTPAYITCNPWASQAPYGSCGGPCGNQNGYSCCA